MRSVSTVVLLYFAIQDCTADRKTSPAHMQSSTGELLDKLVQKLIDREVRLAPLNRLDLDNTTMAKPGVSTRFQSGLSRSVLWQQSRPLRPVLWQSPMPQRKLRPPFPPARPARAYASVEFDHMDDVDDFGKSVSRTSTMNDGVDEFGRPRSATPSGGIDEFGRSRSATEFADEIERYRKAMEKERKDETKRQPPNRVGPGSGTISRFEKKRGFGFITPDDGSPDIFCWTGSLLDGQDNVTQGDFVKYVAKKSDEGKFQAENVQKWAPPYSLAFDGGSRVSNSHFGRLKKKAPTGAAGCSFLIYDSKGRMVDGGAEYLGNQVAPYSEYMGLILGLEKAAAMKQGIRDLHVGGVSALVVNQMTGDILIRDEYLESLHDRASKLVQRFHNVDFSVLKRSSNPDKRGDGRADMAKMWTNYAIDNKDASSSYIEQHFSRVAEEYEKEIYGAKKIEAQTDENENVRKKEEGGDEGQKKGWTGILTKWSKERGFGFIRPDINSGQGNVFCHVHALKHGEDSVKIGDTVSYSLKFDEKQGRYKAANVRLVAHASGPPEGDDIETTGRIDRWFDKGYGYVTPTDDFVHYDESKQVFCHISDIADREEGVIIGDIVSFRKKWDMGMQRYECKEVSLLSRPDPTMPPPSWGDEYEDDGDIEIPLIDLEPKVVGSKTPYYGDGQRARNR